MAHRTKFMLAAIAGAALLAGCAAGPYYDDYGYGNGYDTGYGYPYGSTYYGSPGYATPSVGFGVTYVDRDRRDWRDHRREWRGDRDGDGRSDWRENRGDRDGDGRSDWRNNRGDGHGDRGGRDQHGETSGG